MKKAKKSVKPRKERELRPSEATFVAESLKPGMSKVEAARRAGLDSVPHGRRVSRYRDELIARQLTAADATVENIVRELLRIALFDPRKMFDAEGRLIPITELDDDTAAAIAGLDVERHTEFHDNSDVDEGRDEYVVLKFKLANKNSALDTLAKFHYTKDGRLKNLNDGGPLNPGEKQTVNIVIVERDRRSLPEGDVIDAG